MAEDLDKPLLDRDTFDRKGIDLVYMNHGSFIFTQILGFFCGKKGLTVEIDRVYCQWRRCLNT